MNVSSTDVIELLLALTLLWVSWLTVAYISLRREVDNQERLLEELYHRLGKT